MLAAGKHDLHHVLQSMGISGVPRISPDEMRQALGKEQSRSAQNVAKECQDAAHLVDPTLQDQAQMPRQMLTEPGIVYVCYGGGDRSVSNSLSEVRAVAHAPHA